MPLEVCPAERLETRNSGVESPQKPPQSLPNTPSRTRWRLGNYYSHIRLYAWEG